MNDDGYTRITLRIPTELHARLADQAARKSRSMNAEIIKRLDDSFSGIAGDDLIGTIAGLREDIQRVALDASIQRAGKSAMAAVLTMIPDGRINQDNAEQLKARAKESTDDPLAQLIARVLDNEIELPKAQVDALFDMARKTMGQAFADHYKLESALKRSREKDADKDEAES